ncbi:MAG: DUF1800 domain-containing protein [Armatimonadetes bacterium]|nr:DUF1800 domain-containing protein [Armatimonadota bacterium]
MPISEVAQSSSLFTEAIGQVRSSLPTPPIESIALHRLGFGPRPGDVERVKKQGFENYVREQLNPTNVDPEADKHVGAAMLHIEYEWDDPKTKEKKKVNEDRPLKYINATRQELWKLRAQEMPYQERARPADEVLAATLVRGVYSQWQFREVMADFWHNHFNVNMWVDDDAARVLFPLFDRDVIRKNVFGNFREMLEGVATSAPMLVYLNNYRSVASPANENYARELFELHTLGADHYYNDLYHRWREVPGAVEGKPDGYIDQDVYEAARAFTGWTLADGSWSRGEDGNLPNTGEFLYVDRWHDNYQKRVLGVEFEPNQPPMADGRRVLDLVANHPGTAKYVCKKLVRRFVSDDPPEALVAKAAKVWMDNVKAPDQIKKVMETIVLSQEFKSTWGQKIKRPLEAALGFIRATGQDFTLAPGLNWMIASMGQRLFAYPLPTGHPDTKDYWLGTFSWVQRWNLPGGLMWEGSKLIKPAAPEIPEALSDWESLCRYHVRRTLGYDLDDPTFKLCLAAFSKDRATDPIRKDDQDLHNRIRILQMLVAMTPAFHAR